MNEQEVMLAVSQLVIEDCQRVNHEFIKEAIRQWDAIGKGCFASFIELVVGQMWADMVKRN